MDNNQSYRRKMLKQGVLMAASLAALPLLGWERAARAGKASKSDFHYQDHPNDGKRCANCIEFLPATQAGSADGACRLVAGPISPNGWCMAFTSK